MKKEKTDIESGNAAFVQLLQSIIDYYSSGEVSEAETVLIKKSKKAIKNKNVSKINSCLSQWVQYWDSDLSESEQGFKEQILKMKKGGQMKDDNKTVYLANQRNKVVLISVRTKERWANEFFEDDDEAREFAKQNKLIIVPQPKVDLPDTYMYTINRLLTNDEQQALHKYGVLAVDESYYSDHGEVRSEENNILTLKLVKPMDQAAADALLADAMGSKKEFNATVVKKMEKGGQVSDLAENIMNDHSGNEKVINETLHFGVGEHPYAYMEDLTKSGVKYYEGKNPLFGHINSKEELEKFLSYLEKRDGYLSNPDAAEMKRGGTAGQAIPNNYSGKTDEQVWNAWNDEQRLHFLNDHRGEIKEKHKTEYGDDLIKVYSEAEFINIGSKFKEALKKHISKGQYARGGKADDSREVTFFNVKFTLYHLVWEHKMDEALLQSILYQIKSNRISIADLKKINGITPEIADKILSVEKTGKYARGGIAHRSEIAKTIHSFQKLCPVGTEIQSVVFDKKKFSVIKAKAWLKENNFLYGNADDEKNTLRFRQQGPELFDENSFRTIKLKSGVKAIVACPVEKKAKGGKVVGKTKSGKDIYERKEADDYEDFTPQDHADAAELHKKLSDEYFSEAVSTKTESASRKAQQHYLASVDHDNESGIMQHGGSVSETPKEYFTNLLSRNLPAPALEFLQHEILTDTALVELPSDNTDFKMLEKFINEKYPAPVPEPEFEPEPQPEPVRIPEPEIEEAPEPVVQSRETLKNRLMLLKRMLAKAKATEKQKIKMRIKLVEKLIKK